MARENDRSLMSEISLEEGEKHLLKCFLFAKRVSGLKTNGNILAVYLNLGRQSGDRMISQEVFFFLLRCEQMSPPKEELLLR